MCGTIMLPQSYKMVEDRKHITNIPLTFAKTQFNLISKEKQYALGY